MGGEFRVAAEPDLALVVPIGDFRAEDVGGGGGGVVVIGIVLVLVVVVAVGADLGEEAVGLFDEVLVDGVGVGGAEVEADVAAEDEDGDEAAEEGDLDVVEGAMDLLAAAWEDWGSCSSGRKGSSGASLHCFLTHPPPSPNTVSIFVL